MLSRVGKGLCACGSGRQISCRHLGAGLTAEWNIPGTKGRADAGWRPGRSVDTWCGSLVGEEGLKTARTRGLRLRHLGAPEVRDSQGVRGLVGWGFWVRTPK